VARGSGQDNHAHDEAGHIRQAGENNWNEPDQEHPETSCRNAPERLEPEYRIYRDVLWHESFAAEAVQSQQQRHVRPQERPHPDPDC
jgi:hypothetical protein